MAPQQPRSPTYLLTSPKSPLTTISLPTLLLHPTAWHSLPPDIRAHLCSLLPPISTRSTGDDAPMQHDADTNPLLGPLAGPVKEGVERWQENLRLGFEGRTWRAEALRAGKMRGEGGFEGFVRWERRWLWGMRDGEAEGETGGDEAEGVAEAGMVEMEADGNEERMVNDKEAEVERRDVLEDDTGGCRVEIVSVGADADADDADFANGDGVMKDGDSEGRVVEAYGEKIVKDREGEETVDIESSCARDGMLEGLGSCVLDGTSDVGSPL